MQVFYGQLFLFLVQVQLGFVAELATQANYKVILWFVQVQSGFVASDAVWATQAT